jgi:hypothetical protein
LRWKFQSIPPPGSIYLTPADPTSARAPAPRHELETKAIIDHREPPRRERDALVINARDVLAFRGCTMGEPRVGRQLGGGRGEFAPVQRIDEIPSEDDPLAVPPSQALFDEVIDAALLRFTDVRAEAAAAECGLFGEKRRSIQVAPAPRPAPRV